jgi:hypothetical protein
MTGPDANLIKKIYISWPAACLKQSGTTNTRSVTNKGVAKGGGAGGPGPPQNPSGPPQNKSKTH